MEVSILLAADYANVDSSGKLNVLGAFAQISAPEFPAIHRSMYLVMKLQAGLGEMGGERQLKTVLFDANRREVMALSVGFQVPTMEDGVQPEINVILEYRDVTFPYPGDYEFVILIDKDQKAQLPIKLVKVGKREE